MLKVDKVSLTYKTIPDGSLPALQEIELELKPGEIVSLIGPSGCGKSTLLSLIAGILTPTSGQISYMGQAVKKPSRERMVIFQHHALYPWKTAAQNIEFVLRARGLPSKEIREQTDHLLGLVHLSSFKDHYPQELSGGMQQRVGIARALAANPSLLLLDEPFASLDILTRNLVLEELLEIVHTMKKSLILVTHNIEEALFVGQRVYVMSGQPGQIVNVIEMPEDKPKKLIDMKGNANYISIEKELFQFFVDSRKEDNLVTT